MSLKNTTRMRSQEEQGLMNRSTTRTRPQEEQDLMDKASRKAQLGRGLKEELLMNETSRKALLGRGLKKSGASGMRPQEKHSQNEVSRRARPLEQSFKEHY